LTNGIEAKNKKFIALQIAILADAGLIIYQGNTRFYTSFIQSMFFLITLASLGKIAVNITAPRSS
jgi:hypothetical protein